MTCFVEIPFVFQYMAHFTIILILFLSISHITHSKYASGFVAYFQNFLSGKNPVLYMASFLNFSTVDGSPSLGLF